MLKNNEVKAKALDLVILPICIKNNEKNHEHS